MKRIEKVGELLVRAITYPLRAAIGAGRCIHKSTPDTPYSNFEDNLFFFEIGIRHP